MLKSAKSWSAFTDRFSLKFLRATEDAAMACRPFVGRGDPMGADQAAVDAMRAALQALRMDIRIVIGEGERDKAPRLYTGERLGSSDSPLKLDAAVDPLEGTAICAEGRPGSWSAMALAPRGGLFQAPDIYMSKIACGPEAKNAIDLKAPPAANIQAAARALGKKPEEVTVGVLKRPRHQKLIAAIRKAGARIRLAGDGDVALALETALPDSSLDLLMGTGGSPEGVLAAAALKCLGGGFQGQLVFNNKEEERRARAAGIRGPAGRLRSLEDLAPGPVFFCATAVTDVALEEAGGLAVHGARETAQREKAARQKGKAFALQTLTLSFPGHSKDRPKSGRGRILKKAIRARRRRFLGGKS